MIDDVFGKFRLGGLHRGVSGPMIGYIGPRDVGDRIPVGLSAVKPKLVEKQADKTSNDPVSKKAKE